MSRKKMHVRRGDQVQVISGNHKGARGVVLRVLPAKHQVVVEGVNMRKRHQAPSQKNPEGGIVSFEAPIHVSNVAMFNPATGKADRVGFKSLEDGNKVRIFKSTGEAVDI